MWIYHRLWITLIFILFSPFIHAEKDSTLINTTPIEIVQRRQFDTVALNAYQSKLEFDYGSVLQFEESLWSKLKKWFWSKVQQMIGPDASLFSKIVFYGLLVLGIIGMIMYFSRVETSSIFKRGDYRSKLNAEILDEKIDVHNIDQLIVSAKGKSDFKLATRYLLIKTLIQLENAELIKLQENITVAQYRKAFDVAPLKAEFASLTEIFEYVWYGEYPLQPEQFVAIEMEFQNFFQSIKNI